MMKMAPYLCDILPQNSNPSLIMKKHQTNPSREALHKIPDQSSSNLLGSSETSKV